MRRHRRHWFAQMHDDPFHPDKVPWKNSCGIRNDTMVDMVNTHRNRTAKPLKGLRNEIPNYVVRLKAHTQAIDTNDVAQWFSQPFNETYHFLAQINASLSNIHLRKRHIETQVYVGAFQYLRWKQLNHDMMRNENDNKTKALEYLLTLARNLLCEIETAINNTGMKMPMILTQEVMYNRLTFRNNNRDRNTSNEVDEIDSKFAKIRFNEYLHGLQQVLRNRMGKQHQQFVKKQQKSILLRKKAGVKSSTILPKVIVDNTHVQNQLTVNNLNSGIWTKKHSLHRSNGLKHRNRHGVGKQRRNKKQFQEVVGLGPNEIKTFRRSHKKSTTSSTTPPHSVTSRTSTTMTTTATSTTVTPQL